MSIYEEIKSFYQSITTEKRVIGNSLFGRELYAVKLGSGNPVGIAQYAIHGREWITAKLAKEHFRQGLPRGTVWILPLMNPDGAMLSNAGIQSAPQAAHESLLSINGKSDFSLWKANGRGVDLNVNFPADWGKGKQNIRTPAGENYIGEKPFSEPETAALRDFTRWVKPDFTISYHTKGEEIYWYYAQPLWTVAKDKRLALALSESTGYPLAYAEGSAGGYKDWCIKALKIPAFTVEAGRNNAPHPLGEKELPDLIRHNQNALKILTENI